MAAETGCVYFLSSADTDIIKQSLTTILQELSNANALPDPS